MPSPHLSRAAWTDVYQGQEITGVAIRNRHTLQTLSRPVTSPDTASRLLDGQIPCRVATIFLDDATEDNVGFRDLVGMTHPRLGISRAPFHDGLLVASMDRDGDVYPLGGAVEGPFEKIDVGQWPALQRLRCVGDQTFAVALARGIYRRVELGQWERLPGLPRPTIESALSRAGFRDLDGWSASDLYAVGGLGDVWHFNGSEWRAMDFPSSEPLATVTCGGDGHVYITGEGGSLWVGQRADWRRLLSGQSSILWNDTRWFNGRLWLASDYQLRVWNGQTLEAPLHDGRPLVASGHLDAHDGLLAIADLWTVSTFDGTDWRSVVAPWKSSADFDTARQPRGH